MSTQFKTLKDLVADAERYHQSGEQDISKSILKSAADYAERMSKKSNEISGFKNPKPQTL